jgi:hypothetical protein
MADVTIDRLDITVNVDDDGEGAFARLFEMYIRRWSAQRELGERLRSEAERERTLFDRGAGR